MYNTTIWADMSTMERVANYDNDYFEAPTAVMQTAITPLNASGNIELYWDAEPQPNNPMPGYIATLHFSELRVLDGNATRQFYINLHGDLWYPTGFTPGYLSSDYIFSRFPNRHQGRYNISINATANSTLPPIINAVEVFSVIPTTNLGTDSQDASAAMAIKVKYKVQKNWMGDPCLPKTMMWDKLTCSSATANPPRITSM